MLKKEENDEVRCSKTLHDSKSLFLVFTDFVGGETATLKQ